MDSRNQIDPAALEAIKSYPIADLVKKMYPSLKFASRSLISSPWREDRHPSFTLFRDSRGHYRYEDKATGESGDNIDFFRNSCPGNDYPSACDKLSFMLLGRSAFLDASSGVSVSVPSLVPVSSGSSDDREREGALEVISSCSLLSKGVPERFVKYWRGRGIDDDVISSACEFGVYENKNLKGQPVVDRRTGKQLVNRDGSPRVNKGTFEAILFPNDIGGYAIKCPPSAMSGKGFKGGTSCFVSTYFKSFLHLQNTVEICGEGDGRVYFGRYDAENRRLYFNPSQYFSNVSVSAFPYASVFLQDLDLQVLSGRRAKGVCSVLSALSSDCAPVAGVTEGLFDFLTVGQRCKDRGYGLTLGQDMVVLNSIENIRWSVPFLAKHDTVYMILDNDQKSGAGQRAADELKERIRSFSYACGKVTNVTDMAPRFFPHKDFNDFHVADIRSRKETAAGLVEGVAPVERNENSYQARTGLRR